MAKNLYVGNLPFGTTSDDLREAFAQFGNVSRVQIVTEIDAPQRIVRSGATGRVIRVPDDVAFDALLAARCNQRPAGQTIRFFASGMSCGGAIALTRLGVGYEIRVNWLTGGVEVVPSERL